MSKQYPPGRDKSGYLSEATIAALATAPGGAINVLRVSGPDAYSAVNALADRKIEESEPRKLTRVRLHSSPESWLDDALWVRFAAPESFTGEDVVELHLHGSSFVAGEVLELLARQGVRQALPGEFSFRSVRNGKMSLAQAQAVADLIAAQNGGAVQLALEKLSGTQNRLISELAAALRQLAVLSELGIDFADQDVEEVSLPALKKRLAPIIDSLRRLGDSYERGSRIQEGIRVAFVGLPNAGKSSFFNALLGEDRSIVSEVAGTTRDVVRECLTLRGTAGTLTLRLEDTAGLRHSSDQVEMMGVDRTERAARESDLILFLVDPTVDLSGALAQWARLGRPSAKSLGILTKADRTSPEQRGSALETLRPLGLTSWISTSSTTGEGITDAVEAVIRFCQNWLRREPREVLLTRLDQWSAVRKTLEDLDRAAQASESDLFSADLRQALNSLGPVIGETLPDDILGKIFSDFCIGK